MSLQHRLSALLTTLSIWVVSLATASRAAAFENPSIGLLGENSGYAEDGTLTLSYTILIWNSIIMASEMIVLGYFVWGSIEWMTSGGDSGKLQTARNRMMHAVIGLLLVVSGYTIIAFVGDLAFGSFFNILQPTFITPE